jgi:hypothetical protein
MARRTDVCLLLDEIERLNALVEVLTAEYREEIDQKFKNKLRGQQEAQYQANNGKYEANFE